MRILSFLTVTFLLIAQGSLASTFTSYYAFGDSLSDDGKGITIFDPPPFQGGRLTSGPVWAEYISERFDTAGLDTVNYAVGGATAGDRNLNDLGYLLFDAINPDPDAQSLFALGTFNRQIDQFSEIAGTEQTGDNPLVSVLIGGNDIFDFNRPVAAANAVLAGIERIANLSTNLDDFLVGNLPDLSRTPGDDTPVLSRLATFLYNLQLEIGLRRLETDLDLNITRLNLNAFINDILDDPSALGILNTTDACFDPPDFNCTIIGEDENGNPIFDPALAEVFLYVDDVHPNATVHRAFGQFAIDLLGDQMPAPIATPLPAGLNMMVPGLLILGWQARRRRRRL